MFTVYFLLFTYFYTSVVHSRIVTTRYVTNVTRTYHQRVPVLRFWLALERTEVNSKIKNNRQSNEPHRLYISVHVLQ
jgi:hypothetical protein